MVGSTVVGEVIGWLVGGWLAGWLVGWLVDFGERDGGSWYRACGFA